MDVSVEKEDNVASIKTNSFVEEGEEALENETSLSMSKKDESLVGSDSNSHQEDSPVLETQGLKKCEENAEVEISDDVNLDNALSHDLSSINGNDDKMLLQREFSEPKNNEFIFEEGKETINAERSSPDGMVSEEESLTNNHAEFNDNDGHKVDNNGSGDSKIFADESDVSEIKTEAVEEKKNEWLDILGNGLLKKRVIAEGKGEETRPNPGDEIVLRISGELENGTKLNEQELVFILDDREVIQALDLAVALMEHGEKALLYTDAKYAYGNFGYHEDGFNIPPNSSITYQLELVSIEEGKDKNTLSDDVRISIGERKRKRGNDFYTRGDYGSAIDCYTRALKYLEGSTNKNVIEMLLKCQNNLSAAQIKINAFQAALKSCNSVLNLEPDNVKANFRKGKCLEKVGEAEEALKWMKKASMLDPTSKVIQGELMRIGNYVKKNRQNESMMYKRMVEGLKKDGKDKEAGDKNLSFKIMVGTLIVAGIGILAGFVWYKR